MDLVTLSRTEGQICGMERGSPIRNRRRTWQDQGSAYSLWHDIVLRAKRTGHHPHSMSLHRHTPRHTGGPRRDDSGRRLLGGGSSLHVMHDYPPKELHQWCSLDEDGRREWLDAAKARFFAREQAFEPSREPGRTVVLDGNRIDSLAAFYCEFGEAVNGPGGYFGGSMLGFDDCLFGGFGLNGECRIVWRNSERSRRTLSSQALVAYLEAEYPRPFAEGCEMGEAWRKGTREAALSGERTLFEEMVAIIQSTVERSRHTQPDLVLA